MPDLPLFDLAVCEGCQERLTPDDAAVCPVCASTLVVPSPPGICRTCLQFTFSFDRAIRWGKYRGLLQESILKIKQSEGHILARDLGRLFFRCREKEFANVPVDVVIPIPLHWRHGLLRGYNQSEEIAWGLCDEKPEWRCHPGWLRRVRPAVQHAQPSASARRQNIRGVFQVPSYARVKGAAVLLVDDVMTTGSTLSEAAKMLIQAGASTVTAAVLARQDDTAS